MIIDGDGPHASVVSLRFRSDLRPIPSPLDRVIHAVDLWESIRGHKLVEWR